MDSKHKLYEMKRTSTVVTFSESSQTSDIEDCISSTNDITGRGRLNRWFRKNLLLILTMIGIVIGLIIGFTIRLASPSKDLLMWIGLPGEMFLRMLKMMVLPLIISNVISGTASLGAKSNGKMGGINLVYIVITNLIGCVIGLVFSLIIKPGNNDFGNFANTTTLSITEPVMSSEDIFIDLLRNLFPENIIGATLHQIQTRYEPNVESGVAAPINASQILYTKKLTTAPGTNLVGLIVCAILFGIAASTSGRKGKPFLQFFISTSEIVMKIIQWFLWYSPIGIASLMIFSIASVEGDIDDIFRKLGFFVLTVVAGLILHQGVVLPLILFAVTRKNPFTYLLSLARAWLTAFATTSGAMAMPDLFKACEEDNKIDKRITSFSVPFTVTLNADGSAIFIVSAALFIAQLSGMSMNASQMTILVFLTTVACMALPSVPSSSIVTIVILLSSLGIPGSDIALLFTVEWLMDRLRTACNVASHGVAPAIVYALCRDDVDDEDYSRMKQAGLSDDGESEVTVAFDDMEV